MNLIRLKYRSLLRLYIPLFVVVSIILTACGGDTTPTAASAPTATPRTGAGPAGTAPAPTQASAISNTPVPAPMLTPVPLDHWKVATIPVGTNVGFMAEGAGMIWLDTNSGLQKIDPVANQVTTITTVNKPGPKVMSDGAIWVVDNYNPDISETNAAVLKKLDPTSGKVEAKIALGDYVGDCCTDIAATDGAIWLASFNGDKVMKISTQTNSIVATIPASGPLFLAVGGGSVWVTNHHAQNKDSILRIDLNTNAITARLDLGDQLGSGAILYTDSAVWVASWNRDTDHDVISRIDPQTNAVVATITYSTNLEFTLAVSAGSVWTAAKDGMLLRVDPQSNTIVEKIKVGSNNLALLAIGSTLWLADNDNSTVIKLDLTR